MFQIAIDYLSKGGVAMTGIQPAILNIDDELETTKLLQLNLEAHGYQTVTANYGSEALRAFNERDVELVLLDLGLPDMDGFELCLKLRESSPEVGIIIVSAYTLERDRVAGLEAGADDYLLKPFGMDELLARVRAVLRRVIEGRSAGRFAFDGCQFDSPSCRILFAGSDEVFLTPTECTLLRLLIENAGSVVPHQTLLTQVWGPECLDGQQYLWTYIRCLRNKLRDDADEPRLIFSLSGIGYRFTEEVVRLVDE
jgi:two-component system KDP operon response regulator KdpE